jgi:hypothetical protein
MTRLPPERASIRGSGVSLCVVNHNGAGYLPATLAAADALRPAP